MISGLNGNFKLTRYPVEDNLEILFTHSQQVSLFHEENDILDFNFSEGFLILDCRSTKPIKVKNEQIKVFDVRGVDGPVILNLPGTEAEMRVEVSPGGAFIFGGGINGFYIWIQSDEELFLYEVFFDEVLFGRNS